MSAEVERSILECLYAHAASTPDKVAIRVLGEGVRVREQISYAELLRSVRRHAAVVRRHALEGQRALLLYPTGLAYVEAFLGCFAAGVVAVPAYPPESAPGHAERLLGMAHDARPAVVLTESRLEDAIRSVLVAQGSTLPVLGTDAALTDELLPLRIIDPRELALLQYTSGSTSRPKGVMVSHGNLSANQRAISAAFGITDEDVLVSWLPLYHDMGMLGVLLQALHGGCSLILMSPQQFLRAPLRWLEAISAFGATVSGAPDFGYRLCVERVRDADLATLDLSRWRLAFSGAEPIRADTLARFAETFAPTGFRKTAHYPCYGLAEATLLVSGGEHGRGPEVARFAAEQLEQGQLVRRAGGAPLVCCGRPPRDHALRIVDLERGSALPEGAIGEVWVAGPSVTQGYFENRDATAETYVEVDGVRYLRTGDLGALVDGELYITGRHKDLIIIRGRNLYPQDIERVVEDAVEVLRKGRIVAFGIELDGREQIAIAAEVSTAVQKLAKPSVLGAAIREAVAGAFQEAPGLVLLLTPSALPKTSSGKLQRRATRAAYQAGKLRVYACLRDGAVQDPSASAGAELSALEQTIAQAFRRVLGCEVQDRDASFFALGGSSIAAAEICAVLETQLSVRLDVPQLFAAPTVAGIVRAVEEARARPLAASVPARPAERSTGRSLAPLSQAQQRLWLAAQAEAEPAVLHVALGITLRGPLDVPRLERALLALVSRHEALRTSFELVDGSARQRVHADCPLTVACVDLTAAVLANGAEGALETWRNETAQQPFDLGRGPLLRVALARLEPEREVLLFVAHHAVLDGSSAIIALSELVALYRGDGALPAVTRQLQDAASEDHAGVDSLDEGPALTYFRTQLGDLSSEQKLPLDRPRPSMPSRRAGRVLTKLDAEQAALLRRVAREHAVSPACVLLCTLFATLYRYGSVHPRVGVPTQNRRTIDERTVGLFVNTLVLGLSIEGRRPLRALLEETGRVLREGLSHQRLPFEHLVAALAPERERGRTPLFDVAFNYQPSLSAAFAHASELGFVAGDGFIGLSQFDLTLNVEETTEGGFALSFEYAKELFERMTIERMQASYLGLLRAMLTDSTRELGSLVLVDEAERARLSAAHPYRGSVGMPRVHEQLRELAKRLPQETALVCADGRLSFAELEQQVDALSLRLRALGVSGEQCVGICLGRRCAAVVAMFAVWRAGAAFVPLDPSYPRARLNEMMRAANAALVLVDDDHGPPFEAAETVSVEALSATHVDRAAEAVPASAPEALAYVIFTSGSTGVPKGVAVEHGALAMHIEAARQLYGFGLDDRALHLASLSFDAALEQLLVPLLSGATVVLSADGPSAAEALWTLTTSERVTHLYPPTALLEQLAHVVLSRGVATSVRSITVGGEAVLRESMQLLSSAFPGASVFNGYGPTETVITPLIWPAEGRLASAYAPIGRALGARRAYVLDADLSVLPVGVEGELYIGGEGLARGYCGRAADTALRFLPDPFSRGGRVYRTGDLAKVRPDGTVEFVGRADGQIKLRGYRIELGELESRLSAQPGVREAAALVRNVDGRPQLIAFVAGGGDLGEASLRSALSQALPAYMVPSRVEALEALPRTRNGKIDRRALADLPLAQLNRSGALPEGAREGTLAMLMGELLQVPLVGRDDSFFELGGDSIVALQLVSRAREHGLVLDPRDVLSHPTVRALSQRARVELCDVARGPLDEARTAIALTPIQRAFFAQAMPQRDHFNQSILLQVTQSLEVSALRGTLAALVAHHGALRLRFFADANGHTQRCVPADEALAHELLWERDCADAEALTQACEAAQRSLRLDQGPLFRALFATLPDGTQRLLLVAHHLVIDGVSWRVLLEDLAHGYAMIRRGEAPRFAAGSTFGAWVEALERFASTPMLEAGRAYWSERAAEAPADPLRPTGAIIGTEAQARHAQTTLTRSETRALLREAQQPYRTRGSELLLAALAQAVHTVTGAERLTIEVETHGRDVRVPDVDVSRTLGWFTAVHPLTLEAGNGLAETIILTKEAVRAAQEHALAHGSLPSALSRPALTFNYLGQLDASFAADGALFALAEEAGGSMRDAACPLSNAIALNGLVRAGLMTFEWTYAEGAYPSGFVEALAVAYADALRALVAHCTRDDVARLTPADFPLCGSSQAELDSLPFAANQIEDVWPLTAMQQGIIAYGLAQRERDPYLYRRGFRLTGELDRAAFERAWAQVVARHGALRSVYAWEGLERPVQAVLRAEAAPHGLSVLDLRESSAEARRAFAERDAELTGFRLTHAGPGVLELAQVEEREHWLFWTHHHVALDGWSMATVMRDLLAAYSAACDGKSWRAPAIGLEVERARRTEQIADAARALELREMLAGVDDATPLPVSGDVCEPSGELALPFAEHTLRIDGRVFAALKAQAAAQGVTLSTLVQAAWALLLGRHADRRDVVFGVTVSGRSQAEGSALDVAGLFINTLPLRVRWTPGQRAGDFLRTVQEAGLELGAREHASLGDVQRAMALPEGEPLFESAIVFENYPIDAALRSVHAGLSIGLLDDAERGERGPAGVRYARGRNHYPLSLIAVADQALSLTLSCRRARFRDAAIEQLGQRFVALLGALSARPEAKLFELMLPASPQPALTGERVAPPFRDVLEAWASFSTHQPARIAVRDAAAQLTAAEVDARSRLLAQALQAQALEDEARVAVCLPRGCDLPCAVLGVLRVGAVYVPLELDTPDERMGELLGRANVRCIVSATPFAASLARHGLPVVAIDALSGDPNGVKEPPERERAPERAAYQIFTSGSTGTPKAVTVSHGALAHYVHGMLSRLALEPSATMAMVSTAAADLGHTVLFGALCSGRTLSLMPHEIATDPGAFARFMVEQEVSVLKIVPSHLRALLEVDEPQRVLPKHALILGGEATDPQLLSRVRALAPSCRVINHYGPTETTVGVLTCELADAHTQGRVRVPTGLPLPNVYVRVLDGELSEVPEGVAGELYVGGATLARGYDGRSGATAERFVPDPLACGQRLYRTGDRVRMVAGQVEYLGRSDDQVKIHGHRVELGEVRAALLACEGVRDAAVRVEHAAEHATLRAFYVPAQGALDVHALVQQTLRRRLPTYMQPELVALVELPRTANGKLDVRRLPARARVEEPARTAPINELERTLAGIWSSVLDVDQVGRDDSFVGLGGDSILSLRVIARARKAGLKLTPRLLAEAPSLAKLAEALAPAEYAVEQAPTPVHAAEARHPLSFAQERLWFLWKLDPTSSAYHVSGAVRLRGALDETALLAALQALIARHDVLRTRFEEVDGRPVAIVDETVRALPFARMASIEGGSSAAPLDAAIAQAHALAQQPFDLGAGQLLRVCLIALAPEDQLLSIVFHHIVADGWSLNVFMREFAELYAGARGGRTVELPPLALRYVDFARVQRELLDDAERTRQIAYWRAQLGEDHAPIALSCDRPRPRVQSHRGAEHTLRIEPELARAVRALARTEGTTVYTVLLSAFKVLLARDGDQRDVRVGAILASRPRVETEDMLGFFVNTLVLRSVLAPRVTFRALLHQLRGDLLEAQEHADLPFEQLVDALAPERSLSHNPLFQVLHNHQRRARRALDLPGLTVDKVPPRVSSTQLDLGLYTEEDEDGALTGSLVYATDLFEPETIERMGRRFVRLLTQFTRAPERSVDDAEVLSDDERALLSVNEQTARDYGDVPLLPELIGRQLATEPTRALLHFRGRALSRGEVDGAANALAHRLRQLGVGPDVLVGVHLERSLELPIAVLAIMKAGGAYVPLEPTLPEARLRALAEDARLGLVLTTDPSSAARVFAGANVLDVREVQQRESATPPEVVLSPENLAYVIFTSGSTGRPKAAANRHGALRNRLLWMQEAYALTAEDVLLHKTPFGFDVSVWELFWPLFTGAELVIAEPELHRDPAHLAALALAHGVTTLHFVPSLLQAFLEHPAAARSSSLRRIVCSGEALPVELAASCLRTLPNVRLYNLYGPTEAAIDVTHWSCRGDEPRVPIGHAIANVSVHVLDESLCPVPAGVRGELYLGGAGLARGYHGQPALTAERFVPHPKARGERLYRTGDRGRLRADGAIEYLGRNDSQVKIRGVRIELGEVEAQLRALPGVREAAALVHTAQGDDRLVAYVVLEAARAVDGLYASLRQSLPEAFVPSRIIALERLPLTVSGKVDRKALPAPTWESASYTPPEGERERQLAQLWAEILRVPRVGRDDDFFALGGHSLLATQMMARVESELGVALPLRRLFEATRLRAFAALVAQHAAADGEGAQVDRIASLLLELEAE